MEMDCNGMKKKRKAQGWKTKPTAALQKIVKPKVN